MPPTPARGPVTRATHVREHFRTSAAPNGHGYTLRNADEGTAYYAFDRGIVRCVVLDTVNQHGGWQGSLDAGQFSWLVAELRDCAARPVLLFSHHPLETMVNDLRPPGAARRVLGAELRDVLCSPVRATGTSCSRSTGPGACPGYLCSRSLTVRASRS